MRVLRNIKAAAIGVFFGEREKQKYLYKIQSREQEKKLQAFWKSSGFIQLDDVEMKAFHTS